MRISTGVPAASSAARGRSEPTEAIFGRADKEHLNRTIEREAVTKVRIHLWVDAGNNVPGAHDLPPQFGPETTLPPARTASTPRAVSKRHDCERRRRLITCQVSQYDEI